MKEPAIQCGHAETRRPTTVFPQCLGGLQTVQTIYQHKARAVRPNRDRRPLAVVQHTASTRFCSRVVRRFIGMSAIATVSRFIMIEGEDEFTARRPFLARRTNGSSERFTRRQTALAITPWLSHTN